MGTSSYHYFYPLGFVSTFFLRKVTCLIYSHNFLVIKNQPAMSVTCSFILSAIEALLWVIIIQLSSLFLIWHKLLMLLRNYFAQVVAWCAFIVSGSYGSRFQICKTMRSMSYLSWRFQEYFNSSLSSGGFSSCCFFDRSANFIKRDLFV